MVMMTQIEWYQVDETKLSIYSYFHNKYFYSSDIFLSEVEIIVAIEFSRRKQVGFELLFFYEW